MNIQHPSQLLFTSKHPLTSDLDITYLDCIDHVLTISVAGSEKFADAEGSNVTHTSFSTLILDTVMGGCVLGELEKMQAIATIKLSVNHLRPAFVGEVMVCKAHYDGVVDDVAHITAQLISQKDGSLIASAVGTFMIGTRSRPLDHPAASTVAKASGNSN